MKNRLYFDISRNDTETKKELFEKIKMEFKILIKFNMCLTLLQQYCNNLLI